MPTDLSDFPSFPQIPQPSDPLTHTSGSLKPAERGVRKTQELDITQWLEHRRTKDEGDRDLLKVTWTQAKPKGQDWFARALVTTQTT